MKQGTFDFSTWKRNLDRKEEEREKLRHAVLSRLNDALKLLSENSHGRRSLSLDL